MGTDGFQSPLLAVLAPQRWIYTVTLKRMRAIIDACSGRELSPTENWTRNGPVGLIDSRQLFVC